jgi:arsenical pump membrane protein
MIANAASFVLPISNPANLVVFHNGMPPLSRWLAAFLLPSLLSIVTTYIVLRLYFRRELNSAVDASSEPVALTTDGKLVLLGLAFVVAVLLTASAFGEDLGLPTFVAAVAITAVLLIRTRSNPVPILKQISWSTIALVAALFILVEAVESIGALNFSQHALLAAQQLVAPVAALTVGFTVAIANNLVNNLPLGLIAANTLTLTHTQGLLRDVTLIAIDLGPNLSVTGSLATILWLLALRREGLNVTFFDFLKVGLLAMPVALLASIAASLSITLFTTAH